MGGRYVLRSIAWISDDILPEKRQQRRESALGSVSHAKGNRVANEKVEGGERLIEVCQVTARLA